MPRPASTQLSGRRRRVSVVLATLASALVFVSSADARSCGTYSNEDDATISTEAYYAATCTFAEATASRFYAIDGVPRRLLVMGTRMTYRGPSGHDTGSIWWLYDGRRHGRYLSVIVTQTAVTRSAPPATPPTYTPPTYTPPTYSPPPVIPGGNGYPVVCADGSISNSGGIQGACSHHGGEA